MPELYQFNEVTLESVHLAAIEGTSLVTLGRLESKLPVRVGLDGPSKADASHATATGKAILAWLPEPEIARVIAEGGLKRYTDKTVQSIAVLMEELRHVRRNGYATDNEEFQPGVFCIGAAIRNQSGAVVGSISVSTPHIRADKERVAQLSQLVMESSTAISNQLGNPLM